MRAPALLLALGLALGCSTEPPAVTVERIEAGPVQAGPASVMVESVELQIDPLRVEPLEVPRLEVAPLEVQHRPLALSGDLLRVVVAPAEEWAAELEASCDGGPWELLQARPMPGYTTGSVQLVGLVRCE